MERAFWLLDRATPFNGVNTARLRGPVGAREVRQALAHVQLRNALLRVGVSEQPAAFIPVGGPLPLATPLRADARSFRASERNEINHRYAPGELLCRAAWHEGPDGGELTIAHNHLIADAQSAVLMMRQLCEALGALCAGTPLPPIADRPIGAALTDRLRPTRGFARHFAAMSGFFLRHAYTKVIRRPRKLPLDGAAGISERPLGIVHGELDEVRSQALAQACREHGTTMQGAIGASLLLASAEALALDAPRWLGCFSGVSLRPELGVGDEMGLHAVQVTTYHRVARHHGLWPLARELKQDLASTLARGEQYVAIPMMGMFIPRGHDPAPGLQRSFDLAAPGAIGLTNVGRLDLPREYGPVTLESFHLAVAPSVVSPAVACAATFAGRLSLNLVHAEPLLAPAHATALLDRALSLLASA